MSRKKTITAIVVVLLAAVALVVTSVGGNDKDTPSPQEVDGAFTAQMIPHHEGAIEMAEMAQTSSEHPQIKKLANEIIETQNAEIGELEAIGERLSAESADGDLGMDDSMMGMDMDMGSLETADPFDREFIDQMIAHHQGAIRMARVALRDGEDREVQELALAIVDAQAVEILRMNEWREKWYGAPSPSGGVPSLDEPAPVEGEGEAHH
ncbi:MAG TPA: DUF305 domain-containing protein [Solirubrobacterales bacterium]|nr:DUF305 domain-containing protein [Solirubrobacterales bacterium]